MLRFFYKNKSNYEKGQLAPFLIVFLVVLIIMALVTVNIGKIANIKTSSANAADAGALAAGSIMASIFNGQAELNAYMVVGYETFLASMAVSAAFVIWSAIFAAIQCAKMRVFNPLGVLICVPSPACMSLAKAAMVGIAAAMAATIFYQVTQYFNYLNAKKKAEEGMGSAYQAAMRYAFNNSDITGKLPEGGRADFSNFVNSIPEGASSLDYGWTDGQGRRHDAHVEVTIDDLEYDLQVSILPLPILWLLFEDAFSGAFFLLDLCFYCPCNDEFAFAVASAIEYDFYMILAGLLPGPVVNDDLAVIFPIDWIADINPGHKLVKVDTSQRHGSFNYGIWQADYPDIESSSLVDYAGEGQIYEPVLNFDASIIEVD